MNMWAAVRQLTRRYQNTSYVNVIAAETLSQHYARISSDSDCQPPQYRHTAPGNGNDREPVFKLLDKLPARFLRVGVPLFYKPITHLVTSTVPCQWKHTCILPIPETETPQQNADYRPISITPVLSRLLERVIARSYLYPFIIVLPASLYFTDL